MDLDVQRLRFDDQNEEHIARHGVTIGEIEQVWLDEPLYFPNRRGRHAAYLMIGRTYGGRLLTVPLAGDRTVGDFRPITAWDSTPADIARYRAAGGQ